MPRKDVREALVGLGLLAVAYLAAGPVQAQPPVPGSNQVEIRPDRRLATSGAALQSEPIVVSSSQGPLPGFPQPVVEPISSMDQLIRMSPEELDRLYQGGSAVMLPTGQARGKALLRPGTRLAVPLAKATPIFWQGKVINPDSTAVNRFFGVRIIKGNLYVAESWMDGNPALILDYRETSLVYANYRDEIRAVAPGLFLGLMYARTQPRPTFKMYFALQVP